jgi:hypothetical protein
MLLYFLGLMSHTVIISGDNLFQSLLPVRKSTYNCLDCENWLTISKSLWTSTRGREASWPLSQPKRKRSDGAIPGLKGGWIVGFRCNLAFIHVEQYPWTALGLPF